MAKRKRKIDDSRVDLYDFLDDLLMLRDGKKHDFNWQHQRGAANNKGLCPFHDNTNTPAFSIYTTASGTQRWFCFTEDIGGTAYDAAIHSGIFPTDIAAEEWMIANGYAIPTAEDKEERRRIGNIHNFMLWCHDLFMNNDPEAKEDGLCANSIYVMNRHLNEAALDRYPIGYYPRKERIVKWLEEHKIPHEERHHFLASTSDLKIYERGLIFGYTRDMCHICSLKLRNPMKETHDSEGHNVRNFKFLEKCFTTDNKEDKESTGFFCSLQKGIDYSENIFLVEGEFDVLGMASLTTRTNPNATLGFVCFGGSRLVKGSSELKSLGFPTIYAMPDNDAAGDDYVDKLTNIQPDTVVVRPIDIKIKEDPCEWAGRHEYKDFYATMTNPACLKAAYEVRIERLMDGYEEFSKSKQQAVENEAREYAHKLSTKEAQMRVAQLYCSITGIKVSDFMSSIGGASQLASYRYSTDPDDYGIYRTLPFGKSKEEILSTFILTVDSEKVCIVQEGNEEEITRTMTLKLMTEPNAVPTYFTMSSKDFASDQKLQEQLYAYIGASTRINPVHGIRSMREALAVLDTDKKKVIKSYGEPGWHDDIFFMPNGYVDKHGWHESSESSFTKGMIRNGHNFATRYAFSAPNPEVVESLKKSLRVVFKLYGKAAGLIMINHFFSIPFNNFYKDLSPSALWLAATTGFGKTTVCRALMCLYGDFSNAPFEPWTSTDTSITESGYSLKDLPMIIDDFKPATTDPEKVAKVIQGYGDGQSRNRGGWEDNKAITTGSHPVRAGLICTGEDVVKSEASTMARLTVLKLTSDDQARTFTYMTDLQELADDMPQLMPEFIKFFINKGLDPKKFKQEIKDARRKFNGQVHARTVDMMARQYIQWQYTKEFMGWEDLDRDFMLALYDIGLKMGNYVTEEKAGTVFMRYLNDAVCTGEVYLEGICGESDTVHRPTAPIIGWIAPDSVYLLPDTALEKIQHKHKLTTGTPLNFSVDALCEQLKEMNYFLDPKQTGKVQRRVPGGRPRVFILKKGVFGNEEDDPGESLSAGFLSSKTDAERGHD